MGIEDQKDEVHSLGEPLDHGLEVIPARRLFVAAQNTRSIDERQALVYSNAISKQIDEEIAK